VHLLLDLPIGAVTFSVTLTLLVTTVPLLIVFPLALPVAWLLFVSARGLGRMERNRYAALLDLPLVDPHPPLGPGGWFAHLKARATTASRWREIAYLLVRLPIGGVMFALTAAAWCGSLALVALPFYVGHIPGETAKFWLFELGPGSGAWLAFAVGIVGLVFVAPWPTSSARRTSRRRWRP
jgi:hypothetical protein